MSEIPTEAVDALARELDAYEDSDDDEITWESYREDAEAMLRKVAPILAAQVRRETAEQIAEAIEAAVDPLGLGPGPKETEAWRSGMRMAARIARQIGEAP